MYVHAGHPWFKDCKEVEIPLDVRLLKLMRAYMCSSSLRKAALKVSTVPFNYESFLRSKTGMMRNKIKC